MVCGYVVGELMVRKSIVPVITTQAPVQGHSFTKTTEENKIGTALKAQSRRILDFISCWDI
jgi:hypothetical protein